AQISTRPRLLDWYRWLIVLIGVAALASSTALLPVPKFDWRFLILTATMMLVSSRLSVQIPRVNTNITVSDTFIFLVLLLYGGLAGILVAALEGLFSGLRISRRPLVVAFNSAMMLASTSLTVAVVYFWFGPIVNLRSQTTSVFAGAMGTMALVQYFSNTGISAICLACKTRESIWRTWHRHYLGTSLTYLMGAAIAAFSSNSIDRIGLTILFVGGPIIGIVYFTYNKYLNDIKSTAAQAEKAERDRAEAERARAEAERERAEQAERHVEELNRHLAEQERIGRQLQESKDHFRHAAFHDALTNLPNRALLTENLAFVIERAKNSEDYQFAVLFLDLDRFKNVNDSLGHTIGDQLLIAMARRLESCIREVDMVARLGGDEFAILLDGITNATEATNMARRIQAKLSAPFNLSGHEVFTTASIGIALSSTGYDHPENMLRDADTAMYRAKAQGKACYEVFDKGMHTHAVYLLQMENDLRRALDREEFCVYYQPIVTLGTGHLAGFEALIRWNHPERGFINPSDFIPLAEETGLIVPIGQWILKRSCRQLAKWQWQSSSNRNLFMSVNLSSKQVAQPDLVTTISDVLADTNVEAKHLKLEITESAVMDNADLAVRLLKELKALGVQLSIDDFGTGYSSLGYLHRFPVNTLKIDRSFVGRIGEAAENIEIVRTIISLAENMGMEVVAEGVETLSQLNQLRKLNCMYGQGYLFSRPVDAESVTAWIARKPHWQEDLFPAMNEHFVPSLKPAPVMQLARA
ncbi:MAG TPA: EAL domain-containing protein, partial [Pyrinomonadaceae bacterium]|nr:EAL domain-containing protein [Pyrinomonadaceae bacterium]